MKKGDDEMEREGDEKRKTKKAAVCNETLGRRGKIGKR